MIVSRAVTICHNGANINEYYVTPPPVNVKRKTSYCNVVVTGGCRNRTGLLTSGVVDQELPV